MTFSLLTMLLGAASGSPAAQLSAEAAAAWQRYVDNIDGQMQVRLRPGNTFLWLDEQAERRARASQGEVVVEPMRGHGSVAVKGALIHDWIGATFIANTTLAELLGVVTDYDHYQDYYRPAVTASHLVERSSEVDRYSMRLVHKLSLFSYAADTNAEVQTHSPTPHRVYAISQSKSIREVRDFGKDSEHALPPDEGEGFVWRLHSIARYEERDGGVFVELEAVALSRDVPASVRWIVSPMIAKISRNSLVTSLTQTRDALAKFASNHRIVEASASLR